MGQFTKYQHICKLGSSDTRGILDGFVNVFPKLDGTNASCWLDQDNIIQFGSRNRQLYTEKDNQGFLNTCCSSEEIMAGLKFIFQNYGDVVIYGEWLVPHTLKNYSDGAWKHFYIFDIYSLERDEYFTVDNYEPVIKEASKISNGEIRMVPCIWSGYGEQLQDEELLQSIMDNDDFMLKDGKGEGIVIKRYDFVNDYGRTVWAKVINKDFHEKKVEVWGESPEKKTLEEKIIDKFFDNSVIEKEFIRTGDYYEGKAEFHPSQYPELFGRVWKTFLEEEAFDFVKWSKNPVIDFRRLYGQMIMAVKEFVNDGGLDSYNSL